MSKFDFRLTTSTFGIYQCHKIVREVFVHEQGFPDTSPPSSDVDCTYFLGTHISEEDGSGRVTPIATGRIMPIGKIARVQRVAVLAPYRQQKVGSRLIRHIIEYARAVGFREITLNAQVNSQDFYTKLDFTAIGETYEEAGIMHQEMVMVL